MELLTWTQNCWILTSVLPFICSWPFPFLTWGWEEPSSLCLAFWMAQGGLENRGTSFFFFIVHNSGDSLWPRTQFHQSGLLDPVQGFLIWFHEVLVAAFQLQSSLRPNLFIMQIYSTKLCNWSKLLCPRQQNARERCSKRKCIIREITWLENKGCRPRKGCRRKLPLEHAPHAGRLLPLALRCRPGLQSKTENQFFFPKIIFMQNYLEKKTCIGFRLVCKPYHHLLAVRSCLSCLTFLKFRL